MKTGLLEVRPVFARKAIRTRGHVFIISLTYTIIHGTRCLLPDQKDIPFQEIIDELTSIHLVELEDRYEIFYRVPSPNKNTQAILDQLDIKIPWFVPKQSMQIL